MSDESLPELLQQAWKLMLNLPADKLKLIIRMAQDWMRSAPRDGDGEA